MASAGYRSDELRARLGRSGGAARVDGRRPALASTRGRGGGGAPARAVDLQLAVLVRRRAVGDEAPRAARRRGGRGGRDRLQLGGCDREQEGVRRQRRGGETHSPGAGPGRPAAARRPRARRGADAPRCPPSAAWPPRRATRWSCRRPPRPRSSACSASTPRRTTPSCCVGDCAVCGDCVLPWPGNESVNHSLCPDDRCSQALDVAKPRRFHDEGVNRYFASRPVATQPAAPAAATPMQPMVLHPPRATLGSARTRLASCAGGCTRARACSG